MLDLGAHAGLGFVLRTLHFIDPVLGAGWVKSVALGACCWMTLVCP